MRRVVLLFALLLLAAFPALAQDEDKPLYTLPKACEYAPGQPTSKACLDLMAKTPKPDLQRVPVDRTTLSTYSFWKVGPAETPKYDAPGGSVVGDIPKGFNFVHAINTDNPEWLQIEGGEWIARAGAKYVEPSEFTGVILPKDWNTPFAWVLDMTGIYASTTPGGPSTKESGYLTKRYDMVNIFAEAYDKDGWRWYLIGPNQWLKQTFVAKVQPAQRPKGVSGRWVAVDLYEQTLVAYDEDTPAFATLVASGLEKFSTEQGLFTIWARVARDGMSGATGAPDAYALQSVPWVMYFNQSMSLHGTYWHDLFGYRRSHGCVNLSISDARYLFDWTEKSQPGTDGKITNYVWVFSSGKYGEPPRASNL
jgi:hypothetical protein